MLFFHVGELVLATVVAALAFVIAYLFWLGIAHSKKAGKYILKAISVTWFVIAVMEVKSVATEVLALVEGHPVFAASHYLTTIPMQVLLLGAAIYFIKATVRRNPVRDMTNETDAVHEGIDDR